VVSSRAAPIEILRHPNGESIRQMPTLPFWQAASPPTIPESAARLDKLIL
jgi:hypothetical protein